MMSQAETKFHGTRQEQPSGAEENALVFFSAQSCGITRHKKRFKKSPKSTVAAKIRCSLLGGAVEGDELLATQANKAAVIRHGGFIFPKLLWHFCGEN